MPATKYRVYQWGPRVLTAAGQPAGATGAARVAIAGVAKKATAADPYIVVNEVVCNALARSLVLPCPPGATLDNAGETYFFSLDFSLAGQALPPVDPVAVVAAFPRLSWGIILFDSLVMNHDRHTANLAHDTSTSRVQIFDHSHALLQAGAGDISAMLAAADGQLCIGGHCLAQEINDIDGLDMWAERIALIPDFFIEDVMEAATTVGLPNNKKLECIDFMKKRRSEMGSIVENHIGQFPKLPKVTP